MDWTGTGVSVWTHSSASGKPLKTSHDGILTSANGHLQLKPQKGFNHFILLDSHRHACSERAARPVLALQQPKNYFKSTEKSIRWSSCIIIHLSQWPTTVSSDPCVRVWEQVRARGGGAHSCMLLCCQLAECRPWSHCCSMTCTYMGMNKIPLVTIAPFMRILSTLL